jgi:hypothetical protein
MRIEVRLVYLAVKACLGLNNTSLAIEVYTLAPFAVSLNLKLFIGIVDIEHLNFPIQSLLTVTFLLSV